MPYKKHKIFMEKISVIVGKDKIKLPEASDKSVDDVPKMEEIDRDAENERRAKEVIEKNTAWKARGQQIKSDTEEDGPKIEESKSEPDRHKLNPKNEEWTNKEKEGDKRSEKNPEDSIAEPKQKELSEKVKSMRAYEERKAIQEEEMRRDKTKYLEKYDTRMKGKTSAGKFISKMAGWLGLGDRNRIGRGKELKDTEKEFYGNLENYTTLKDRVAQIESDIFSGRRKNAKGENVRFSQEVFDRYRAKMARLELVRISTEQRDVAEKRSETWNQIEEQNHIVEQGKKSFWKSAFKHTLGNRYVRFALTTGAIGAMTGGVSSGAWLLGRGIKFGAGIVGGKLGQKGAQFAVGKLLNEEKFISNRYNKIASDYANGNINAHEYDKELEKIQLQLNRIKNLLPALVAGASAAGASYGLSKLDASTHVFDKISDKASDVLKTQKMIAEIGLAKAGEIISNTTDKAGDAIIRNAIPYTTPFHYLGFRDVPEVPDVPNSPEVNIPDSHNITREPDVFKVRVPDGAGAIKSIEVLQNHLKELYEGKDASVPKDLSDFINGDADKIAIENDWYKPLETSESISVLRGSTIEWDFENNKPVIHNAGGTPQHFFDSGAKINPTSVFENPLSSEAEADSKIPESLEVSNQDLLNLDSKIDLPLDYKFLPGENFSEPIESDHFKGMIEFIVGSDGSPQIDFDKLGITFPENLGGNYFTDNPKTIIENAVSGNPNANESINILQKQYNISDEGKIVGSSRLLPYETYRLLYEELNPAPGTPEYTFLYQRLTNLGNKITSDFGSDSLKPVDWQ